MRSHLLIVPILGALLVGPVRGEMLETTVGGFRAGGFRDTPTIVDGVLRGQLARLEAFVETGRPGGGSQ